MAQLPLVLGRPVLKSQSDLGPVCLLRACSTAAAALGKYWLERGEGTPDTVGACERRAILRIRTRRNVLGIREYRVAAHIALCALICIVVGTRWESTVVAALGVLRRRLRGFGGVEAEGEGHCGVSVRWAFLTTPNL